jgi:hypothetical protein
MTVCAAVLYCPAVNSELFSVNFLQGLNEEIAMLIFLILGDFDCRKQKRQMELLHFPDAWKHWEAVGYNVTEKNNSKDKGCNAEGKNLIDFLKCTFSEFSIENLDMIYEGNLLLLINLVVV